MLTCVGLELVGDGEGHGGVEGDFSLNGRHLEELTELILVPFRALAHLAEQQAG
jgi:hypothetical protein